MLLLVGLLATACAAGCELAGKCRAAAKFTANCGACIRPTRFKNLRIGPKHTGAISLGQLDAKAAAANCQQGLFHDNQDCIGA